MSSKIVHQKVHIYIRRFASLCSISQVLLVGQFQAAHGLGHSNANKPQHVSFHLHSGLNKLQEVCFMLEMNLKVGRLAVLSFFVFELTDGFVLTDRVLEELWTVSMMN